MLKFLKTRSLFSLFFHVLFSLDLIHVNVWLLSLGQCCHCYSVAQARLTSCDPVHCRTPGFPVLHHHLELAQIHIHWVGDAIQPSHPVILFSSCLQSFPASWSFPVSWLFASAQSILARNFGFSISPSSEFAGLVSFRIDCFDLAVQGTLESSPIPHLESINSLAFSFLYGQTLTSIHDYWKNCILDYMGLCWQSNVSAF